MNRNILNFLHASFFLALVAMLTIAPSMAQAATEDQKYLKGAVPEVNGIVTFKQTFSVPGKSDGQIRSTMNAYAKSLLAQGIEGLRTRLMSEDSASTVVKVEEYMIFKKKFLNLDRTRFRYLFSVECQTGGKVTMTLTQISYYYNEDMQGENGETYKAEEWISDREAINKAGTKLYPRSGKFRRKTIDRVEAIFQGARDLFEEPEEPVKKKSATIVE